MTLDVHFLAQTSGADRVIRAFQWDGLDLTALRDFVKIYSESETVVVDTSIDDPAGGNVYAKNPGSVWIYDPSEPSHGPYSIGMGMWIMIQPFSDCEIAIFDGPGYSYVEIPKR